LYAYSTYNDTGPAGFTARLSGCLQLEIKIIKTVS